jgi:hypothetical protein
MIGAHKMWGWLVVSSGAAQIRQTPSVVVDPKFFYPCPFLSSCCSIAKKYIPLPFSSAINSW